MSAHVLVIEQDGPDPVDLKHHIECPGVTESYRVWWECGQPHDEEELWDTEESHGVYHQMINGTWSTEGTLCICRAMDYDIDGWPVGRHDVRLETEDEYLILHPTSEAKP